MTLPKASYRTRFAPSPTGLLHAGHAFSALTSFQAALNAKGEWILRIEDIDFTRCKDVYVKAIFDDLGQLGLIWPQAVLFQSSRTQAYLHALNRLLAMGVIYEDLTPRQKLDQALSAPQGDDKEATDRAPKKAPAPALRLSLDKARALLKDRFDDLSFVELGRGPNGETGTIKAKPELNGDVILGRKDIGLSYHLCVVIDDDFQAISHIHRGHDLFLATHTHVLLQALLDLPTPTYCHHPLLLDDTGQRLAKRKGSKALRDLFEANTPPEQVIAAIFDHPRG